MSLDDNLVEKKFSAILESSQIIKYEESLGYIKQRMKSYRYGDTTEFYETTMDWMLLLLSTNNQFYDEIVSITNIREGTPEVRALIMLDVASLTSKKIVKCCTDYNYLSPIIDVHLDVGGIGADFQVEKSTQGDSLTAILYSYYLFSIMTEQIYKFEESRFHFQLAAGRFYELYGSSYCTAGCSYRFSTSKQFETVSIYKVVRDSNVKKQYGNSFTYIRNCKIISKLDEHEKFFLVKDYLRDYSSLEQKSINVVIGEWQIGHEIRKINENISVTKEKWSLLMILEDTPHLLVNDIKEKMIKIDRLWEGKLVEQALMELETEGLLRFYDDSKRWMRDDRHKKSKGNPIMALNKSRNYGLEELYSVFLENGWREGYMSFKRELNQQKKNKIMNERCGEWKRIQDLKIDIEEIVVERVPVEIVENIRCEEILDSMKQSIVNTEVIVKEKVIEQHGQYDNILGELNLEYNDIVNSYTICGTVMPIIEFICCELCNSVEREIEIIDGKCELCDEYNCLCCPPGLEMGLYEQYDDNLSGGLNLSQHSNLDYNNFVNSYTICGKVLPIIELICEPCKSVEQLIEISDDKCEVCDEYECLCCPLGLKDFEVMPLVEYLKFKNDARKTKIKDYNDIEGSV